MSGYEKNERGMYPYVVAAYRIAGEEFWHVESFPAPYETIGECLEERQIFPIALRLIMDRAAVAHPDFAGCFCDAYAFSRGWNVGFNGSSWYAPGETIPEHPGCQNLNIEPITISLCSIHWGWLSVKLRQGTKLIYISFDDLLMDALPVWTHMLKNLRENLEGHATIKDDGFFSAYHIWGRGKNGFVHFRFRHRNGKYNEQWDSVMTLESILSSWEDFFHQILDHPAFVYEFVCWDDEDLDMDCYEQTYEMILKDWRKERRHFLKLKKKSFDRKIYIKEKHRFMRERLAAAFPLSENRLRAYDFYKDMLVNFNVRKDKWGNIV